MYCILQDAITGWKSAPEVNSSLADDPAILKPGFNIPRRYWAFKWSSPSNNFAARLVRLMSFLNILVN